MECLTKRKLAANKLLSNVEKFRRTHLPITANITNSSHFTKLNDFIFYLLFYTVASKRFP